MRHFRISPIIITFIFTVLSGSCTDSLKEDFDLYESIHSRSISSEASETLKKQYSEYYWYENEKVPLYKMANKFLVMYDCSDSARIHRILANSNIKFKSADKSFGYNYGVKTKVAGRSTFANKHITTIEGDSAALSAVLSEAFYWTPYYQMEDGREIKIGNKFYVELESKEDLPILKNFANENGVDLLYEEDFIKNWYCLGCSETSKGNALELANLFHESGLFKFSCPDISGVGQLTELNEPLYISGDLWHLGNNLVSPNIDINYCASQTLLSQGSSKVIVGIIDSGVDINHRDLYNVLPGWDATTQTAPNKVSNPHGTEVAGFIGAIPNNNMDVAGIGYGTTILPVSIYVNSSGGIDVAPEIMKNAIEYAVKNGAMVISCSWNYKHQMITSAIKEALDRGRIFVFSAGNTGKDIGSPANSDSRIIVVGAINKNGYRASFSSYGYELDVVAPGENVYTLYPGNRTTIASGTSFATPQVAGLAAMILSKYPDSSLFDVRYRILKTARRLESYFHNYNISPFISPFNVEVGHGLIDAYAALSPDVPSTLAINISNVATNKPMGAFRVELYDENYKPVQLQSYDFDNDSGTLLPGESFKALFSLIPGTYIANVVCETDGGVEMDYKFDFKISGGTISFEYVGETDATVHWRNTDYYIGGYNII